MELDAKSAIENGRTALGIEFGSTRIKAVLTDMNHEVLATGNHDWENRLVDNIWTYSLDAVWKGLQDCYRDLAGNVKTKYGTEIRTLGSLGFSAMMHGYMAFDRDGGLLVPFRTWRNTMTQEACGKLTSLFNYPIPQRWSIAHLYQAILNGEGHVGDIAFFTTLAGYIHWQLSGEKVLGVGDASGMFPVDTDTKDFNKRMIARFDELVADKNYRWKLADIMPGVLVAGDRAGTLTEAGARLLDVTGTLQAGIPMCPPEGDAGTGMVATNSVARRTGNISAGTSVFAMAVLEKELSGAHDGIDLVTTPDGSPVAMVHCNNCTSDLNAWVGIFREFQESVGQKADMDELYGTLYRKALEGDADCGGLLAYGYLSGEHVTGFSEGRPLFVRTPGSNFNLANFMRVHLFTALGAIRIGMDILFKQENVTLDGLVGHGGLFRTEGVGQRVVAAAVNVPVSVMKTAGEGGAWGIAVLAGYMMKKGADESLSDFLDNKVFAGGESVRMEPDAGDVAGFEVFIERYKKGLAIERAAVESV